MTVVIDTNVLLVANGQHQGVGPACVVTCANRLRAVMKDGRIAIDDGYRIIREYQNKTKAGGGPRPGDAFLAWVLRNNFNPKHCDQLPLVEHADRGFESFPDDSRLAKFDPPDRKFVAVAAAHTLKPPVLQAADSKWLGWAPALKEHEIEVEFLCGADIKAFAANKKKSKSKGKGKAG